MSNAQSRAGSNLTQFVTIWTMREVTGFTPTTPYEVSVRAQDAAANDSSASSPLAVATAADTTPPTPPTGLASSALTREAVTLTWGASTDDVGVTGYAIYARVGSAVRLQVGTAGAGATTFHVAGLSPGTPYTLSVEATDAAGNHSTPAATTVTTTSTPSSGGGCSHGSAAGWALPALAPGLSMRRRRDART